MVTNLMGSSFEVKKITGSSWYDVEDYGIALAEGHFFTPRTLVDTTGPSGTIWISTLPSVFLVIRVPPR